MQECEPTDDPNIVKCFNYIEPEILKHIASEWGTRTNLTDFAVYAKWYGDK